MGGCRCGERFGDAFFEFFDFSAVVADNMMMVMVAVEFKICRIFMQINAAKQVFFLERSECAIHRNQIDFRRKCIENLLGGKRIALLGEKRENRDARRRDFESVVPQEPFDFSICFCFCFLFLHEFFPI